MMNYGHVIYVATSLLEAKMYTERFRTYVRARTNYYKHAHMAISWLSTMIWTMLIMTLSLLFTIMYVIAINNIPLVLVIRR